MKFVTDIQNAWKWFSMQAMAIAAAIQMALLGLPADMRTGIVLTIFQWATLVVVLGGMFGRLIDQTKSPIDLTGATETPKEPDPAP